MAIASFSAQPFATIIGLVAFVRNPANNVTVIHGIFSPSDGTGFWVLFYE